eukprot:gene7342-463_t
MATCEYENDKISRVSLLWFAYLDLVNGILAFGRFFKILKVMALSAASVKNFHLELLTLLAQEAAAARGGPCLADGSMQLVLDVLQSIADDKMPTSGAAESQIHLSEDQFGVLVSRLKVCAHVSMFVCTVSRRGVKPKFIGANQANVLQKAHKLAWQTLIQ